MSCEFSSDRWKSNTVPGGDEGSIDSFVGDASVLGLKWCWPSTKNIVGVVEERRLSWSGDDESTPRGGLGGGRGVPELTMNPDSQQGWDHQCFYHFLDSMAPLGGIYSLKTKKYNKQRNV